MLGHARRFRAEIVNYADDLCVLGKAPAAETLAAVGRLVAGLKLAVNERKTRCLRCPEEAFEFLGYRIGRNYRPHGQGAYIGTRPSKASVQSICRRISEMTSRRWSRLPSEARVERLNRVMTGWANYFSLGQVCPAYSAVDWHAGPAASPVALSQAQGEDREIRALPGHEAARRLRPHPPVAEDQGPSACEGMISSESRMRENPHVRFDERGLETRPWEPD